MPPSSARLAPRTSALAPDIVEDKATGKETAALENNACRDIRRTGASGLTLRISQWVTSPDSTEVPDILLVQK